MNDYGRLHAKKGLLLTNPTPSTRELAHVRGSTHPGELRIAGDSTSSSLTADVTFTDDARIVVTSAGMTLVEWNAGDVVIESTGPVTTIGCHGDLLMFEPSNKDAWKLQIAAHRLRTPLRIQSRVWATGSSSLQRRTQLGI